MVILSSIICKGANNLSIAGVLPVPLPPTKIIKILAVLDWSFVYILTLLPIAADRAARIPPTTKLLGIFKMNFNSLPYSLNTLGNLSIGISKEFCAFCSKILNNAWLAGLIYSLKSSSSSSIY